MELIAKLRDAGSMFWAALDERERTLLLYAAFALLVALEASARAERERRREQRIVAQVRRELTGAA